MERIKNIHCKTRYIEISTKSTRRRSFSAGVQEDLVGLTFKVLLLLKQSGSIIKWVHSVH